MRGAIRFRHLSLHRDPLRHIGTKENRKIDRAAALRNQRRHRARQSGGTGGLHAGRAQRHPQKRECPIGVAQNATPQLARVWIRKQIHRRPGHRGRAVRQQDLPRHRGPAAEPQDIDSLSTLTSHRSEVAHHRPVEPFRQRNRLTDGRHSEGAAQGGIGPLLGAGHAGPQIVEPLRRHRSIQTALQNDGDRFVVPDIGHIRGGQRKRNARHYKIESKRAFRIGENLRHPDFVIHAAIGTDLLVIVCQGDRQIDPGGSVRTQDAAPHFETLLKPGPDRQGRSGYRIPPQIRDRGAEGQGARHQCPDRLAQYQQRDAPTWLHLHRSSPVPAVQQIGRGIACRRLGHRFIEEDGEDIAKVLHWHG